MAETIHSKPLEIISATPEILRLRLAGGCEFDVPAAILPHGVNLEKIILDLVPTVSAGAEKRHQRLQEMIN